MGLFKFVGNVIKLPIAVATDIVTVGGITTDKKQPYTAKQTKKTLKSLASLLDLDD